LFFVAFSLRVRELQLSPGLRTRARYLLIWLVAIAIGTCPSDARTQHERPARLPGSGNDGRIHAAQGPRVCRGPSRRFGQPVPR